MNHFNVVPRWELDEEIDFKKRRTVANGKFTRMTNLFTGAHGDETLITVLHGIYGKIRAAFNSVDGITEDLMMRV